MINSEERFPHVTRASIKLIVYLLRGAGSLLLLFLISLSSLGQASSSSVTIVGPTPPARSGSGKIKGRVVNESGQPLPNVTVYVSKFDSFRVDESVVSDRDGNFELTGLDQAIYRLSAHLGAYTPMPGTLNEGTENKYRVGDNVMLTLIKGGVITGTVTNQNGEPVVGVGVHARMIGQKDQVSWLYRLIPLERTTDDRGVYRLYGLPAGTYVVWAGGSSQLNGEADLFDTDSPTYAPASTRDTAAEIRVESGEEISNVDIRYRGDSGRRISGKVIGPKVPIGEGYGVLLSVPKDGGSQWHMMADQRDETEGFVFDGVGDGDYEIRALARPSDGQFRLSPVKRIRVSGADVTGIELTPEPLAFVSGRVVLQESNVPDCKDKQRPVFSETLLTASPSSAASGAFFWPFGPPVNADAQGGFVMKNMPPGRYYFGAHFAGNDWYLDSITLPNAKTPPAAKPVDAANTWTTLKPADRVNGLTITLAKGAASFQGQVGLMEGERRTEAAFVSLVPAEREKAEDVLRYFAAEVSGDGKFELNSIAPGRYLILLTSRPLEDLRAPEQTELRSSLRRDAEAAKTEIEFKPCQKVSGFQIKGM